MLRGTYKDKKFWFRNKISKFKMKPSKFVFLLCVVRSFTLSSSSASSVNSSSFLFSIDQYLNATENNSDQNIYYDLNRNFKLGSGQNFKAELNLNWSQNENYLYPHISNLFYEFQGANFAVGFKKVNWSENLDYFKSPEWQQQLERNKLHPKTGGNLGFYYEASVQNLKIDVMYSPYFIPSRGPDIDFKNGVAVTENPWFLLPPDEVPYEGDTFSTRYQIKDPDMSDLLRQQSLAIKVNAVENKKWILNLAYANKPSPRLVTDLDFTANIAEPEVPIDVFINARAVRHQLLSTDLSYLFSRNTKVTVGYLNENFDTQSLSSVSETYMNPMDQNNYTLLITHKTKKFELGIGGIYRDGGRSIAEGELASALVNQNLNYIYEQAVKIDFTYLKTWGWSLNTSFSYDFLQKGLLTSMLFQRQFSNAIINLGFDALEPLDASDQSSFVYQYRNLDRVWAGLSYVF